MRRGPDAHCAVECRELSVEPLTPFYKEGPPNQEGGEPIGGSHQWEGGGMEALTGWEMLQASFAALSLAPSRGSSSSLVETHQPLGWLPPSCQADGHTPGSLLRAMPPNQAGAAASLLHGANLGRDPARHFPSAPTSLPSSPSWGREWESAHSSLALPQNETSPGG